MIINVFLVCIIIVYHVIIRLSGKIHFFCLTTRILRVFLCHHLFYFIYYSNKLKEVKRMDKIKFRQVPNCPGGTVYTIKPGDSYFTLAPRFNTTIAALQAANPNVDPQNLQIGMQICIPVAPTPGACPGGFLYVIRAGDTYFSIARRFGIAVPALAAANPGVNPNALVIGRSICVPAPKPISCPGGRSYTIVSGDTLYSISRRYNTTVEAILAANPGINPQGLQPGQILCIPT